MERVYLDHNATTPLDPRVLEAMLPWFSELHGNPSSLHSHGQRAREAVEAARTTLAEHLGGVPLEFVFTASGTEANNAVILGLARAAALARPTPPKAVARAEPSAPAPHLVISALEHPSILEAADRLEAEGVEVSRVPPDASGVVDAERLERSLRPETFLVCLMLANNEVGTLQPVAEVAAACRSRGVPVLCDAVQAVGKVRVRADELGVDYLTVGAHKFYGPLGAAALWVKGGATFEPYLFGGGQERRRRAGTENVPAIVGLGTALALASNELEERSRKSADLRDRFERGLASIAEVSVHGSEAARLPNTSNVAFHEAAADSLMIRLDLQGFSVSAGSACSSGKATPSAALTAMGIDPAEALSSLRVSFGYTNTIDEVDRFLAALETSVAALRRHADAALSASG